MSTGKHYDSQVMNSAIEMFQEASQLLNMANAELADSYTGLESDVRRKFSKIEVKDTSKLLNKSYEIVDASSQAISNIESLETITLETGFSNQVINNLNLNTYTEGNISVQNELLKLQGMTEDEYFSLIDNCTFLSDEEKELAKSLFLEGNFRASFVVFLRADCNKQIENKEAELKELQRNLQEAKYNDMDYPYYEHLCNNVLMSEDHPEYAYYLELKAKFDNYDNNQDVKRLEQEIQALKQQKYHYEVAIKEWSFDYLDNKEEYLNYSVNSENIANLLNICEDYYTRHQGLTEQDFVDICNYHGIDPDSVNRILFWQELQKANWYNESGDFFTNWGLRTDVNTETSLEARALTYLTEEELKKYNYLYEIEGSDRAKEYLLAKEDSINNLQGIEEALKTIDAIQSGDYMATRIYQAFKEGGESGITSWLNNTLTFFNGNTTMTSQEYADMYVSQMIMGAVSCQEIPKEELTKLYQNGQISDVVYNKLITKDTISNYDLLYEKGEITESEYSGYQQLAKSQEYQNLINKIGDSSFLGIQESSYLSTFYNAGISTGYMVPSVLMSMMGSGVSPTFARFLASGSMFTSSYSGSYKDAIRTGSSEVSATIFALLSAGSEVGLEIALGGITGIAKGDDFIDLAVDVNKMNSYLDVIKNSVVNYGDSITSEVREELIQLAFGKVLEGTVLGRPIDLSNIQGEALQTVLCTIITTNALNMPSNIMNFSHQSKEYLDYTNNVQLTIDLGNGKTIEYTGRDLQSFLDNNGNIDYNKINNDVNTKVQTSNTNVNQNPINISKLASLTSNFIEFLNNNLQGNWRENITEGELEDLSFVDPRNMQDLLNRVNENLSKRQNQEKNLSEEVLNKINQIVASMDEKYGIGEGIQALKGVFSTGNPDLITRYNGARDLILNLSLSDIATYLKNIGTKSDSSLETNVSSKVQDKLAIKDVASLNMKLKQDVPNYEKVAKDADFDDIFSLLIDQSSLSETVDMQEIKVQESEFKNGYNHDFTVEARKELEILKATLEAKTLELNQKYADLVASLKNKLNDLNTQTNNSEIEIESKNSEEIEVITPFEPIQENSSGFEPINPQAVNQTSLNPFKIDNEFRNVIKDMINGNIAFRAATTISGDIINKYFPYTSLYLSIQKLSDMYIQMRNDGLDITPSDLYVSICKLGRRVDYDDIIIKALESLIADVENRTKTLPNVDNLDYNLYKYFKNFNEYVNDYGVNFALVLIYQTILNDGNFISLDQFYALYSKLLDLEDIFAIINKNVIEDGRTLPVVSKYKDTLNKYFFGKMNNFSASNLRSIYLEMKLDGIDISPIEMYALYSNYSLSRKSDEGFLTEFLYQQGNRDANGNIGADQGIFKIIDKTSLEYQRILNNTMQKYNLSKLNAIKLFDMIDKQGACTYAAFVDHIVSAFRGNATYFEEIFGFPFYVVKEDGTSIINYAEILIDLYVYMNDKEQFGNLFKNKKGKLKIVDKNSAHQQYLTSYIFDARELISAYLASKDKTLRYNSKLFYDSLESINNSLSINDRLVKLKESVITNFQQGYNIDVIIRTYNGEASVSLVNLFSGRVSTLSQNEGHAITMVDYNESGIIVNTWGSLYTISWEDLATCGVKFAKSEIRKS